MSDWDGRGRPVNVKELYEYLVGEYGYIGSYKSILRYVRSNFPKPRIRTFVGLRPLQVLRGRLIGVSLRT